MNIDVVISALPEIASLVMTIAVAVFSIKFLPFLKNSSEDSQIKIIKQWAEFLVESAERLGLSNKIGDLTKKEYVMNKLMDIVEKNGYVFTEDQLDDIRRAAVIVYENTYKMADLTIDTLLDGVGYEKA